MRARHLVILCLATLGGIAAGCTKRVVDLSGHRCSSEGTCMPGYLCDAATETCLPEDTEGLCVPGTVFSCSGCGDDCRDSVRNAPPVCVERGGGHACGYTACDPGHVDLDDDTTNGCECTAGVEVCDGADDDCNGVTDDVAQASLDAACAAQWPQALNVTAWDCRSGACVVDACAPGWAAVGSQPETGCDYPCEPTTPPAEICDGLDNDCDGRTDGEDEDLNEQPEVGADCRTRMCSDCGVATWACAPEGCAVGVCLTNRVDANGSAGDGCECAVLSEAAACAAIGKNCDTVPEVDFCGEVRPVDCGDCLAPQSCGGAGTPNVCGRWWHCGWSWRRDLTVRASDIADNQVGASHAVALVLDHATLVGAGHSLASGDDLRIVHFDGTTWTELERVLDPESSWNDVATTIWFPLAAPLAAGESTEDAYFLYYANAAAGPPPADEGQVFFFADFFDGDAAEDAGNGWLLTEATGADIDLLDGQLWFTSTDVSSEMPKAERLFREEISGKLSARFGFDWARTGSDHDYAVTMSLRKMPFDSYLGPVVFWTGSAAVGAEESLCYRDSTGHTCVAQISGPTEIEMLVDTVIGSYTLLLPGVNPIQGLRFEQEGVALLDRVYLSSARAAAGDFGSRGFDYVIVRRRVDHEPEVEAGLTWRSDEQGCPAVE